MRAAPYGRTSQVVVEGLEDPVWLMADASCHDVWLPEQPASIRDIVELVRKRLDTDRDGNPVAWDAAHWFRYWPYHLDQIRNQCFVVGGDFAGLAKLDAETMVEGLLNGPFRPLAAQLRRRIGDSADPAATFILSVLDRAEYIH